MDGDSAQATYDYNVTGVDMGLQSDPRLKLRVNGSCRTDYTWLTDSVGRADRYAFFGVDVVSIKYRPEMYLPPKLEFGLDYGSKGPNTSYAMIITTAGLYLHTPGQDPWYLTERSGVNASAAYQVSRRRPVLSCWEYNKWRLNGKEVDTSDLDKLRGLKLSSPWIDVFKDQFSIPRVFWVGVLGGESALKSASYFAASWYVLDAGASSIKNDLERLVLAAWVSSRNVLRDTTTYDRSGMQNFVEGPGGSVEDATLQFVLQSGDVVTLSARILISVPSILLFLLIAQQSFSWAHHTVIAG